LLQVHGLPLMQWAMLGLQRGGVRHLMVNTAWLGEQIPAQFGAILHTPGQTAMHLHYSPEGEDFGGALETAGGIVRALPRLADVFWVAAGDVFAPGFEFSMAVYESFKASSALAHVWLVPNPPHNRSGDFGLSENGRALNLPKLPPGAALSMDDVPRYTFSTIALYKRTFFESEWCDIPAGNPQGIKAPLAAMLRAAMDNDAVTASLFTGAWTDVGTPERLAELNAASFVSPSLDRHTS
jgi:N-acetyl-alpha-D-muramate 1-phosphate uridylyltransferase